MNMLTNIHTRQTLIGSIRLIGKVAIIAVDLVEIVGIGLILL